MPDGDTNEVSVKVAVRIRPLTNREKLHKHQPCVKIVSETNQIIIGKDKAFTFDYVLTPKTSQNSLYDECVDGLVDSFFEGYNATVFAYGQTGAGKTYTISGNQARDEEVGIIPRAVQKMFDIMKDQQDKQFSVKVSFLEIYKEELKDLLDSSAKEMHIREDEYGNITINNATEINCSTLDDVMSCFNAGSTMRHTGSTNMNEQSSRSHSIFTVLVEQRWTSDVNNNKSNNALNASEYYDTNICDTTSDVFYLGAKFHFVDLAGSERVGRTGNVGDRFKESIHINSGLLALGNVISALSSNEKKKITHIPYRDSKITRILKDSLGGNAKTLMICCISPSSVNLDESINAVKYASRARYIKNKPIVNMDPQTQRFVEMQSEIKALREELHRQRTQLASAEVNTNQQNEMRQLENKILSVQNECDHYKKLVKDACTRFKEISKSNDLDESIKGLIMHWFEFIENPKNKLDYDSEDYAKQRILQLEVELQKAQIDLKSDEEIFADKEKEISDLKERIKDLEANLSTTNRYLEASYAKEKEQQELMVQLQIQLDKMMLGKQHSETNSRLSSINETEIMNEKSNLQTKSASTPALNAQLKERAKTAPNAQLNLIKQYKSKNIFKNFDSGTINPFIYSEETRKNRNIFSSPALFSLEKVMQGFRARSQLLAETLEENDNVLQKEFLTPDNDDETNNNHELNKQTFVRRGTYNKKKQINKANDQDDANNDELDALTKSTEFRQKVLKESENKLKEAQKKMRDLSINIRMKEELIKELVASSKSAHRVNVQNQHRIETLQKEANLAKTELAEMQRALQHVNGKDTSEKNKIEIEYKKKLEAAQQKINDLESRQKDTLKALNSTLSNNPDKRIADLELQINKLKQQQEIAQRKIKDENEKKTKLEKDLEKEQQKIKDLQSRNEQQQKILKKKTEDLAAAQRRLRSTSSCGIADENNNNNQNKHWVEQEMEKIFQERKQLESLKEELANREELCRKRELLLQEKNELKIKKLRSSQNVRESLNVVNQKIENLDKQLKESHNSNNSVFKDNLFQTQSSLIQQRKQLDERLNQGCILSTAEERRLIEIEEAIEALDIAIKFENDSIKDQEIKLKKSQVLNNSTDLSDNVLSKLTEIPHEEAKYLVKKFFQKIIDLKELERKKELLNDELQVQLDEKSRLVEELKKSINVTSHDLDRRLTLQQQQYEKQISSLLEQLNDCSVKIVSYEKEINQYKDKMRKTTATKRINNNNNIDDNNDSGDYLSYSNNNNNNNIISESNRHLPFINNSNGFHLNEHSIAMATSQQQQQQTARTITSASTLSTQRNSSVNDFLNQTTSNNLKNGNVGLTSVNYCKDSLNDASINQDSNSKQLIKISRKDLKPLSEADLLKRSKKGTS